MELERECLPGHGAYFSAEHAGRAVTLHQFAYPGCPKITAFECGDHWHIGHETRADKEVCMTNQPLRSEDKSTRPRKRRV